MNKIECKVYTNDIVRHLTQVVSGFFKIKKNPQYSVIFSRNNDESYSGAYLLTRINNIKVVYDLYDNSTINGEIYSQCDFYFKRSFLDSHAIDYPKVRALGFYFAIADYFKELHPFKFNLQNTAGAFLGRTMHLCEKDILTDPFVSDNPRILFIPRLWDPDAPDIENNDVRKERIEINSFRIACVKECLKKFPESFTGGIQPTDFAFKHLGTDLQLIMDKKSTIRGRYINIMKSTDICVSTQGLHKSNPGKIAEYIAASRAIVSEPLHYKVTGNFEEGKNYLSFSSVDELISNILTLYNNSELRLEMMKSNRDYRDRYSLTEKIVENSINTVIAQSSTTE